MEKVEVSGVLRPERRNVYGLSCFVPQTMEGQRRALISMIAVKLEREASMLADVMV